MDGFSVYATRQYLYEQASKTYVKINLQILFYLDRKGTEKIYTIIIFLRVSFSFISNNRFFILSYY